MKSTLRLAVATSAALFCAPLTPTATAADTQTVASFQKTITKNVGYHYLVSLPIGYEVAAGKKWPVILFLHGAGERGTDPWLVAKHGPPKLIRGEMPAPPPAPATPAATPAPVETPEARERREAAATMLRENFLVVSPQCPTGTWWDDDAVLALLDEVMAKHQTDAGRIYLTGLSMGGFGT